GGGGGSGGGGGNGGGGGAVTVGSVGSVKVGSRSPCAGPVRTTAAKSPAQPMNASKINRRMSYLPPSQRAGRAFRYGLSRGRGSPCRTGSFGPGRSPERQRSRQRPAGARSGSRAGGRPRLLPTAVPRAPARWQSHGAPRSNNHRELPLRSRSLSASPLPFESRGP